MKKVLMMVFVAMMAMGSYAQMGNPQNKQKEFPSKELVQALNLSQDQVAKLKSADADFKAKKKEEMQKMMQDEKAQKMDMKEVMSKEKSERLDMIKKNLSPEQYVGFLEFEFIHSENDRPMMRKGGMMGQPMGQPQNENKEDQPQNGIE
jgi:hypothetical protein